MAAAGSSKAIIAAFLANLGIAISKFVGFWFTGSSSMLYARPMYVEPGFLSDLAPNVVDQERT